MNIEFNKIENALIKDMMGEIEAICPPDSPAYYTMIINLISQRLQNPLNTSKGNQHYMNIAQKIAYAHMSQEIDDILAEVGEIEVESTKAQSLKKVTNFTENHQEVLSMINKYPKSSRRELAVHLGWPINRVTPRIKELLEMHKIKVSGTKYDEKTERNVETLELV